MKRKNKNIFTTFIVSFAVFSGIFLHMSIVNAGYTLEKIAFYTYKDRYTATNYQPEGTAFYAFLTQKTDTLPVYRFYNATTGDHFYTINENEKSNIISSNPSYTYEKISFYAFSTQKTNSVPVYRFLNKTNGDHFYTANENEKNTVQNAMKSIYTYEGTAFYAFSTQVTDSTKIDRFYNNQNGDHFYTADEDEATKLNDLSKKNSDPIYRFYNSQNGDHFYTANENEKNKIINTPGFAYKYEGAGFYAYKTQIDGTDPIYRFYGTNGDHFYTADESEKDNLIRSNSSYTYEGIAFYAFGSQVANTLPVYRLYNGLDHFYTLNETEKNYLVTSAIGPNIAVGLWYYDKSGIENDPFEIEANKPYNIKDKDGNVLAQIAGGTRTKVTYDSDGYLEVYDSISSTKVKTSVTFDAADGDNASLIFDVHRPDSSYDDYRGKITVRYYKGGDIYNGNTSTTVTQIWVINTLPLEHYVWGMGETTGTGDIEHTKVMTTIFRTYGRWYIEYATKYAPLGFKIRSDAGSQIYKGYVWEKAYPNIKKAAEATRGSIATYGDEIALTPYSSWSDGRTRSYKERWGSSDYPWCKSVDDPYGEHPSKSTATLEAEGNHMVGLIANGSLELAGDHDWKYDKIMKYYYTGISLEPLY